jgi:hypothetical protein
VGSNSAEVIALAWPEHHAMFVRIAIDCDVSHRQQEPCSISGTVRSSAAAIASAPGMHDMQQADITIAGFQDGKL